MTVAVSMAFGAVLMMASTRGYLVQAHVKSSDEGALRVPLYSSRLSHPSNGLLNGRQSGPGNFANSEVATWMLGRVNQYLGQCRNAVNMDVWAVSHHTIQLGALNAAEAYDYNVGFRRVGAYKVPSVSQTVEGDIVQVGNGIHTYVVVANLGSGKLKVVDANHLWNGVVHTYVRSFNYRNEASESTIWRVGRLEKR